MANSLLDRLKYYLPRRRWRLRYPLGNGQYESRLFGPKADENDPHAKAIAVLEASEWLETKQHEQDIQDHTRDKQEARKRQGRSLDRAGEAAKSFKRGHIKRETALARISEDLDDIISARTDERRLEQPQLKLLNRIAELEPIAEQAQILARENEKLAKENEAFRAIVEAQGRAAVAEVRPLTELVEQFVNAKAAEMKAKGRQAKTFTPIRTSARAVVAWLADYKPCIEMNANLEGCPRALGDYRDEIVEQLEEKSSGWARKSLDGPRQFCEWMVERGYLSTLPRSITRRWMQVGKDDPNPTFFSAEEVKLLIKSAPDDNIKLGIYLGINCAYRESDIVSLDPKDIDFAQREIRRTRHKTGALQCHRLWPETASLLKKRDGFRDLRYISRKLTRFIDETLEGNADLGDKRRTAKSLRSTASQFVEDATNGEAPHLVSQMLGQKDPSVRQHYRKTNFEALYRIIEQIRTTIV